MTAVVRMWLAALVFLAAACVATQTPADPAASVSPAARPDKLRVELAVDIDVSELPRLMAIEAMRAQGYPLEILTLANTNATILALERGDLDLANVQDVTGWAAIEHGAKIVAVLDDSVDPFILAVRTDIKRCADLNGRRVGVGGLASGRTVMLRQYIQKHCPGTQPAIMVVAGEPARMAGLLAGELDATVVEWSNLDEMDSARRGEVSSLVAFAEEFPGLTLNSQFASRDVVARHPATVRAWLRALLEARRRLQDVQVFTDEIVKRLGFAPDFARKTAVAHLERKFWDVNGRYTPEIVQRNIDFAVQAAGLKPMKASEVSDLSLLNAVLDEIGRK